MVKKQATKDNTDLQKMVRREVIGAIREMLSDPDSGKELTQAFERKLKTSTKEKAGGKVSPLADLFA